MGRKEQERLIADLRDENRQLRAALADKRRDLPAAIAERLRVKDMPPSVYGIVRDVLTLREEVLAAWTAEDNGKEAAS